MMILIALCALIALGVAGNAFAAPQFETITSVDNYAAALTCAQKGHHYFARLSKTKVVRIRDFSEAMLAQDQMPVKEIAKFLKAKSKVPVNVKDGRVVSRQRMVPCGERGHNGSDTATRGAILASPQCALSQRRVGFSKA